MCRNMQQRAIFLLICRILSFLNTDIKGGKERVWNGKKNASC